MFRATSSMILSHKRSPSVPRLWTGGRARFLEADLGIDIQRVDESAVSGADDLSGDSGDDALE